MIIKVCGLREPSNIHEVLSLGVDWIGMVFNQQSPRNVTMIPTHAGIIPDKGQALVEDSLAVKRVGVFCDEMPQNVITRVVNFALDVIQLDGSETPTVIRNLKATLVPDIQPDVCVMKSIAVSCREDLMRWQTYADCVDLFRFELSSTEALSLLDDYGGKLPFLVGGTFGTDDVAALRSLHHPQFLGVDIGLGFETAPAVKDVEQLRRFIEGLHSL